MSSKHGAEEDKNSVRKDVVYKTILRCIRRYYTKKYRRYLQTLSLGRKRLSIAHQVEIVEEYCRHEFGESADNQSLKFFVLILVQQKLFTQAVKTKLMPSKIAKKAEEMYECLYSFKIYKFKNIIKNRCLQSLVSHMMENDRDQVLNSEKTMIENPGSYLEAFRECFRID